MSIESGGVTIDSVNLCCLHLLCLQSLPASGASQWVGSCIVWSKYWSLLTLSMCYFGRVYGLEHSNIKIKSRELFEEKLSPFKATTITRSAPCGWIGVGFWWMSLKLSSALIGHSLLYICRQLLIYEKYHNRREAFPASCCLMITVSFRGGMHTLEDGVSWMLEDEGEPANLTQMSSSPKMLLYV